jgi:V8-like Glu-specific endopeptidase
MRSSRLPVLLLATLLALLSIGLSGPGAGAAPPDDGRPLVHAPTGDADAVAAYWTAERRADAVSAEVLLSEHEAPRGRRVERGTPRLVAPVHHRPGHAGGPGGGGDDGGGNGTETVTGATWTDGDALVASTTGKLFFTLGTTNYVCSGSVVTAKNESLVLTAGHCIHEGSGGPDGFATNVAFIPAYAGSGTDQVGPYGVWTASSLATTQQWATSGSLDYDVGFIVTDQQDGVTISETVGGAQGIAFNQARGAHVYAFGYPHASPYDGTTLTYCAGSTVNDPFGGSAQGVTCDMTGGSSGGPWYTGFATVEGTGTAYSVNSYRYNIGRHRDKMFGPYFGSVVETLYATAEQ